MKKITFKVGFVEMKNESRYIGIFIVWVTLFYIYMLIFHFPLGIIMGIGYLVIFFLSRFRIKLVGRNK